MCNLTLYNFVSLEYPEMVSFVLVIVFAQLKQMVIISAVGRAVNNSLQYFG